jgi:phosphoglucosamine mutase
MTLRFGTDGVRGVANRDLTPELVTALGRAAARVLGAESWIVGRDTRRSGPMLEAALVAGLCAEGAEVAAAGVLPTPGIAFLSQARGAPAAMISASHNPFRDNGVKLFASGGRKISDDDERRIESELVALLGSDTSAVAGSDGIAVGSWAPLPDSTGAYIDHLVGALDGRRLDGIVVVVDCGNGAAYEVAPRALEALGATVVVLNASPDGTNINAGCGSTDPSQLQRTVVERGAHLGLAFDGDADRVIAVDERGDVVDGDQMLAIAALDLRERGRLRHDAIAATVMSNLGLRNVLSAHAIALVETPVGDRNVLVAMEEHDLVLGGEQSGHVIFADHATTGDGTLTGIVLLDAVARSGRPLSALAGVVTRLPQVLRNVRISSGAVLDEPDASSFWREVDAVADDLGSGGRVLVRPSGTEPVVRVMVEAETETRAAQMAQRLVDALQGLGQTGATRA